MGTSGSVFCRGCKSAETLATTGPATETQLSVLTLTG